MPVTESPLTIAELADLALIPPVLNTSPLPRYGYDKLDYGMTIGLERTPGGRLWACWVVGGDSERGFFVLATSDDDGATWSDPRLVIDPHDDGLPLTRRTLVGTLWTDPKGRLWLFFDQSMRYFDGRAGDWYTRCDNPDSDTPQWTPPVRIADGVTLNKPIVLSTGEWMLPVSLWNRSKMAPPFLDAFTELDARRMAQVWVSTDEGETWSMRGGVRFPYPDFDEHNLVELHDGSLWMTARTGDNRGMYESTSHDRGATWTAPRHYLPQCSARHFMRRLKSGRILMVKHGHPVDSRPPVRSHLTAYLSEDEGATWKGGLVLDERGIISYPDGAQSADGRIFVSHDYNRDTDGHILLSRFTEEDVLAGECVAPGSELKILISRPNPEAVAARHAREKGSV